MSAGEAALLAALDAAEPTGARPLGELLERLAVAGHLRAVRREAGAAGVDATTIAVRGIAYDSRRVVPGGVFVAVPGAHVDGHDFAARAVAAGAVAVVVERLLPVAGPAVQVIVDSSQRALAVVAAWWYGDPGRDLGIVGITGTDGKTTTAAMTLAVLEASGVRTGLLSTAALKVGEAKADALAHVTTPEAPELQRALRAMRAAGDGAAVVEATSHGLALERVGEVPFDVAVFTNLSHEHLEFHGSFDAYRAAKRTLFERLAQAGRRPAKPRTLPGGRAWPVGGIVNADDPESHVFAAAAHDAGAAVLAYGTAPGADVRATSVDASTAGIAAAVVTPRGPIDLRLSLVGRFNVHNALAAIAVGELLELDPAAVVARLRRLSRRPRADGAGRSRPAVHRDRRLRPHPRVAGHGARRPRPARDGRRRAHRGVRLGGRARRGQAAAAGARRRASAAASSSSPTRIRGARTGRRSSSRSRRGRSRRAAGGATTSSLVADREAAIRAALSRARAGDVVLLAGKGHERGILYADHELPWDERAVAERLLGELGY